MVAMVWTVALERGDHVPCCMLAVTCRQVDCRKGPIGAWPVWHDPSDPAVQR